MSASAPAARVVEERLVAAAGVPLFVVEEWAERFPWLVAGATARGDITGEGGSGEARGFDLGLFGANPVGDALARWRALIAATGMRGAAHSRQAHETRVQVHGTAHEGLLVSDRYDGHVTGEPGLLLTVSVADCVPILLVDADARAIAALHAGWRGVAAGMLEQGIAALRARAGSRPERVWMHAGPAICGKCYEVGPEVHEALGLPRPDGNTPVDLRAVLVGRAAALGLDAHRVTISAHCTKCGPGGFFSHRAGQPGRQMGVIGIRTT